VAGSLKTEEKTKFVERDGKEGNLQLADSFD